MVFFPWPSATLHLCKIRVSESDFGWSYTDRGVHSYHQNLKFQIILLTYNIPLVQKTSCSRGPLLAYNFPSFVLQQEAPLFIEILFCFEIFIPKP